MQHRERSREACREARDELRRQRDFRHQHQRLFAARDDVGDRAQVDLGLAAAGHAMQHERRIAPMRRDDRADRCVLFGRQFGTQFACDRVRDRSSGDEVLAHTDHPAALLQFAHVVAPAIGERAEFRRSGGAVRRQVVGELAQFGGAGADGLGLPGAGRGAQRPALGGGHRVRSVAQGNRQRGRDDLAGRVPVVLRRPAQQVEQGRVEHRLVVDERERALQPGLGHVRAIAQLDDHADGLAPPERHPNPLTRLQFSVVDGGRCPVVEQAPQGCVDRHAQDRAGHRPRLRAVVHNRCGKLCG